MMTICLEKETGNLTLALPVPNIGKDPSLHISYSGVKGIITSLGVKELEPIL